MARLIGKSDRTPLTAHDELRGRVATLDREIHRTTEDIESLEQSAANSRKYLAELEGLKVDYENVIMLAFSKSVD